MHYHFHRSASCFLVKAMCAASLGKFCCWYCMRHRCLFCSLHNFMWLCYFEVLYHQIKYLPLFNNAKTMGEKKDVLNSSNMSIQGFKCNAVVVMSDYNFVDCWPLERHNRTRNILLLFWCLNISVLTILSNCCLFP